MNPCCSKCGSVMTKDYDNKWYCPECRKDGRISDKIFGLR